jgi:hypothetical protein
MEARRGPQVFRVVVVIVLASLATIAAGSAESHESWNSDASGNWIEVGGQESSEESSGGTVVSASGGPVIETMTVTDCSGFMPDGTTPEACSDPFTCPENDEPGAELHVRVLNFQRELDPATGEPLSGWAYVGTSCIPFDAIPDEPGDPPSLLALVIEEWRRVQIPAASINVVPPGGRTLVNFDTIVYTDAGDIAFPVTILGRNVVINAQPVTYTWVFGDGATTTTSSPGVPYREGEPIGSDAIVHQYREPGPVTLRVDVEYSAEFTVDGGPPQAIPGSAEVTGDTAELTVVEARSQLIDPDG